MRLSFFLINLIFVAYVNCQSDTCFNSISDLSGNDGCQSSRRNVKLDAALKSRDSNNFFNALRFVKCNGSDWTSEGTSSYVTETFEGLENQYNEYKNDNGTNGENAGYSLCIGNCIRNVFETRRLSKSRIIYHLRHTGAVDYTWVIEQLANQAGYRIYQSYNKIYDLNTWLNFKSDNFISNLNVNFEKYREFLNQQIIEGSNQIFNISSKLDLANEKWSPTWKKIFQTNNNFLDKKNRDSFTNYVDKILNYNQNDYVGAWTNYAGGKTIQWTALLSYINSLSNLTSYFDVFLSSSGIVDFNKENFNQFISNWNNLYGAPNRYLDTLIRTYNDNLTYRFEIKAVKIENNPDCIYNRNVINSANSLKILPFLYFSFFLILFKF